jgi:hypothetical protein
MGEDGIGRETAVDDWSGLAWITWGAESWLVLAWR